MHVLNLHSRYKWQIVHDKYAWASPFYEALCSLLTFFAAGTTYKNYGDIENALSFGEYGTLYLLIDCYPVFQVTLPCAQPSSFTYLWLISWFFAALSRSVLEAGYGLDCLMAQFQGLDLRLSENWPGPAGVQWAATRNQVCAQYEKDILRSGEIFNPRPTSTSIRNFVGTTCSIL
jgi:hypothetical protein